MVTGGAVSGASWRIGDGRCLKAPMRSELKLRGCTVRGRWACHEKLQLICLRQCVSLASLQLNNGAAAVDSASAHYASHLCLSDCFHIQLFRVCCAPQEHLLSAHTVIHNASPFRFIEGRVIATGYTLLLGIRHGQCTHAGQQRDQEQAHLVRSRAPHSPKPDMDSVRTLRSIVAGKTRGKPFTDTLEINSPSRAKPLRSSIPLGLSYGVPYDNAAFPRSFQSLFHVRLGVAVE